MSEKMAQAEHLYGGERGKVLGQLEESLRPLKTKTTVGSEEESLKEARTSTELQFICLLESAGGSKQFFAIPREMFSLGLGLSSSPLLFVDLVDAEGESVGLFLPHPNVPVVPEKSAVFAAAFDYKDRYHWWIWNPNVHGTWGFKVSPICWSTIGSGSWESNLVVLLPFLPAGKRGTGAQLSDVYSLHFLDGRRRSSKMQTGKG